MAILKKSDLNEDQLASLKYIHAFLRGPNRQMVLTGPAGTGKTSLVNVLLDELDDDDKYEYICTAPTNKAVGVIAANTGRPFHKTIYSLLGLTLVENDDTGPKLKAQGKCTFNDYDLIVIDEASMVSQALVDAIQRQLLESTRMKVIYVGDRCQLPPVDDQLSGLHESIVFELPLSTNLSKVMRTASENPILGAVTAMRANMLSEDDLFEHTTAVGANGIGIYFSQDTKDFMNNMLTYFLDDRFKTDSNYAMAVAYTNAAVDSMNMKIRAALYPGVVDDYVADEEIRVTQPFVVSEKSGRGERTKVVYTMEERLRIIDCEACNDPKYNIPAYKMTVENFNAPSSDRTRMTAYVVKPSAMRQFYEYKANLAQEAKLRQLETGSGGERVYSNKEAWAEYNKFKNYWLFVGYIYALTVHKAQGSTIENVFVIEKNINRLYDDHEMRNKLKYTAFTRAAKELHVLY